MYIEARRNTYAFMRTLKKCLKRHLTTCCTYLCSMCMLSAFSIDRHLCYDRWLLCFDMQLYFISCNKREPYWNTEANINKWTRLTQISVQNCFLWGIWPPNCLSKMTQSVQTRNTDVVSALRSTRDISDWEVGLVSSEKIHTKCYHLDSNGPRLSGTHTKSLTTRWPRAWGHLCWSEEEFICVITCLDITQSICQRYSIRQCMK